MTSRTKTVTGVVDLASQTMLDLMKPRGRFYGTQGSFPSYNPQLGGQTTCHTLQFADTLVIFDTGSGIIGLGNELIKDHLTPGITWRDVDDFMTKFMNTHGCNADDLGKAMVQAGLITQQKPLRIYIIFSHFHGDHLYGLQSFKPIYSPNTEIEFFSGMHGGRTPATQNDLFGVERVLKERVFCHPTYPVEEAWLQSKRKYNVVQENQTFHLPCSIGHITAEAAAKHAFEAKPKLIITTHHDPDAEFETVVDIARTIEEKSGIRTKFAMQNMPF